MFDELNNILDIYKREYPIVRTVQLFIVDKITDRSGVCTDLCGAVNAECVGDYQYIGKYRTKKTIPKQIFIINDTKITKENYIIVLLHEIAHCLCDHTERKIKNNWIIFDHPNIFYDKYIEVFNYAIKNNILENKYDEVNVKLLKHLGEFI